MTNSNDKPTSYKIGLCLAGAATGGAFSAGVMDFFLEAMNEWERQKKLNDPDVPPWDVNLKEIIGTSAGGITSTLSVASLNIDHEPLSNGFQQNNPDTPEPKNNPLFRTWVKELNAERLFSNDDLEIKSDDELPTIKSVLNSNFMKDISHEVLQADQIKPDLPDWASKVSLSLTATNMRGIPYSIKSFNSGSVEDEFRMLYHADYSQFVVTTCPEKVSSYLKSTRHLLDLSTSRDTEEWIRLIECSRATSAFPVGLPTVQIKTPRSHYEKRLASPPNWSQLEDEKEVHDIDTKMPSEDDKSDGNDLYAYSALDGGALNNEPFGLLENLMEERYHGGLEPNGENSWASLILIDPFCDASEDNNMVEGDTSIAKTLNPLVKAVRGQALFKVDEIKKVTDKENMAKFLLKPNRHLLEKPKYELATGTMGTFGGILDEKIRLHDFQLGRVNCKEFLETVFCISREEALKNKIFGQYPEHLTEERIPIIPLVGTAAEPIPMPEWPSYSPKELIRIEERIVDLFAKRVEKMTAVFFREINFYKPTSWSLWQHSKNLASHLVTKAVVEYLTKFCREAVKKELSNFK